MDLMWEALVAAIVGFYTFLARDVWTVPWRIRSSGPHALRLPQVRYSWDDGAYYAYAPIPWWQEAALWPLLRLADKHPLRRLPARYATADLAWRDLKEHAALRGDRAGAAFAAGRQWLYRDPVDETAQSLPPPLTTSAAYGVTLAQAAEGLALFVMRQRGDRDDDR